jgi:hypothetical protein
MQVLEKYRLNF